MEAFLHPISYSFTFKLSRLTETNSKSMQISSERFRQRRHKLMGFSPIYLLPSSLRSPPIPSPLYPSPFHVFFFQCNWFHWHHWRFWSFVYLSDLTSHFFSSIMTTTLTLMIFLSCFQDELESLQGQISDTISTKIPVLWYLFIYVRLIRIRISFVKCKRFFFFQYQ